MNLIETDIMFPEYRAGMDTDEYLRENTNYLFLLREDLNYALHNLGVANFNSRKLELLSDKITQPVYSRIENTEGHIASLTYDYGLIQARVSDNEQSITDIRIDAQGTRSQVLEIQGDISDISGNVSGITARVSTLEQTASGITSTVQEIQQDYISATSAKQTSSAFSLTVNNGSGSTAALIDKNGLSVYGGALSLYSAGTSASNRVLYADNSGNLYIKGQITATALSLGNGVTIDASKLSGVLNTSVIGNGSITGNMISANTITGNNLAANSITAAKIASGAITSDKIAANAITANEIASGAITAAKIASGAITADKIAANSVTAEKINATDLHVSAANIDGTLAARNINLSGYDGTIGAIDSQISLAYSSISLSCLYGLKIESSRGIVLLSSGTKCFSFSSDGSIIPGDSEHASETGWEAQQIGYSNRRWNVGYFNNVFGQTPEAGSSDRNVKNTISYDIDKYDAFFDALMPASFKYNNGTSDRTHLGLIAQQVLDGLIIAGLTSQDFAGYVQDETDGRLYLRYAEFIPLCIRQIQLLKARVAALED